MNYKESKLCPVCGNQLCYKKLVCPNCKSEFPIDTPLSRYYYLDENDKQFLETFLSCRGNMKAVQTALNISYPFAARRLNEVLQALDLYTEKEGVIIDMQMLNDVETDGSKASDIIKKKLYSNFGITTVHSINGKSYVIKAANDGKSFICDDLPITPPYEYIVFDVIVDLLVNQGGKARKGNGRNHRFGTGDCTPDTVVGAIALKYAGKKIGESVYDPVFVLASVLEWAGIVNNCRGYIELTADYKAKSF